MNKSCWPIVCLLAVCLSPCSNGVRFGLADLSARQRAFGIDSRGGRVTARWAVDGRVSLGSPKGLGGARGTNG